MQTYGACLSVFFLGLFFALLSSETAIAKPLQQDDTPQALRRHCRGVGPIEPDPGDPAALPFANDYCGCTWGEVYYRGLPIPEMTVQLTFGISTTIDSTLLDEDSDQPIYRLTGDEMGAKLGDLMTASTEFAGQTISRSFRAAPDGQSNQHVPLVIPAEGTWSEWIIEDGVTALVATDTQLWAGGTTGPFTVGLQTGEKKSHPLSWTVPAVRDIAVAPNGDVWVIGSNDIASYDGSDWTAHTVNGLAGLRAVAADPNSGEIWLGDRTGQLAKYDGSSWLVVGDIGEYISDLAFDAEGKLWIATRGSGVFRQTDGALSTWPQFRLDDGLASDEVTVIATSDESVWFGTAPYFDSVKNKFVGGISQFSLMDQTWQSHVGGGLPVDPLLADAPARIDALSVDAADTSIWAGTASGLYRKVQSTLWLKEPMVGTDGVRGVMQAGTQLIAAHKNGLEMADSAAPSGQPPIAEISTQGPMSVPQDGVVNLVGSASDPDEDGDEIVAWEWTVDGNVPLCTTAGSCEFSPSNIDELSIGTHAINLRVLDDKGLWSEQATVPLTITEPDVAGESQDEIILLPMVIR